MLLHESIGHLPVFAEYARSANLVEAHEPRVARDVSRDYGGEPSSDTGRLVLLGGQNPVLLPAAILYEGQTRRQGLGKLKAPNVGFGSKPEVLTCPVRRPP
jgi:hypothetical protein